MNNLKLDINQQNPNQMKKTIVIMQFVLTLNAFSQTIHPIVLEPTGLSTNGYSIEFLEGGSNAFLKYKSPNIHSAEPSNLPVLERLSYSKILMSGIKSLLFEYKNYSGKFLTGYSIFALGNYSIYTDQLLEYANKLFLPDQNLLKKVYDWILPDYQIAFNSLTIDEQQIIADKLLTCEKYIECKTKSNGQEEFDNWLKVNTFEVDEKIIGFLNRRLDKNQWTLTDCRYWINRLKSDFLPLLKNKNDISSHYQVTDCISPDLYIATNHKGEYWLLNSDFTLVDSNKYVWIQKQSDTLLYGYKSYNTDNYEELNLINFPYHEFPK